MARFSHSAAILTLVGSPPLASLATDELRRSWSRTSSTTACPSIRVCSFTILRRNGVPSEMLVFPDEGHWVLKGWIASSGKSRSGWRSIC